MVQEEAGKKNNQEMGSAYWVTTNKKAKTDDPWDPISGMIPGLGLMINTCLGRAPWTEMATS